MSILSPLFYYIIKYVREVFLVAVAIWWLLTPHNAFISQTILFFCLGAYFSILSKNPLEIFYNHKKLLLALCFTFAIGDIVVHTISVTPINLQIHRLALIFNIPALLIIADYCCQHGFSSKLLPNAAFIVFCVHYPIVVVMRKVCATKLGDASDLIHIPLYFVCVIITTGISLLIYMLMDRYMPKIKNSQSFRCGCMLSDITPFTGIQYAKELRLFGAAYSDNRAYGTERINFVSNGVMNGAGYTDENFD
jgi:hypothetical protein